MVTAARRRHSIIAADALAQSDEVSGDNACTTTKGSLQGLHHRLRDTVADQ